MSNTRQAGSQKQPSSGRTAPKAKKERRRQGRGEWNNFVRVFFSIGGAGVMQGGR